MKIIEHRVNLPSAEPITPYAEIDVQLGPRGLFLVRHDITDSGPYLFQYLQKSKHEGFFVNVKQSLSMLHLERLCTWMGERLIGLFDVPFPQAYYAKAAVPLYLRTSEYEFYENVTNRFWIDPLRSQQAYNHGLLFNRVLGEDAQSKAIFACPSLHGNHIDKCKPVWHWINGRSHVYKSRVEGLVTKYPKECREYLDA